MNQDYTTGNVYHFVGHADPDNHEQNFATLIKILKSRKILHSPGNPCAHEISYTIDKNASLLDEKLILPNIICFCDIPFDSLGIHISKYGYFGVAINKQFLAARGARPVMYMPYRKDDIFSAYGISLIKDIDSIYKKLSELASIEGANISTRILGEVPDDTELKVIKGCFEKDFMAFVKPYYISLERTDDGNYYMEREWRLLGNIEFNYNENILSHVVIKKGYKNQLLKAIPEIAQDKIKEV